MPPSSPSRRSPAREHIKESAHGRSHSLNNKFNAQDKDDRLALFDEINKHDREKLLVHSSNDFDGWIGNAINLWSSSLICSLGDNYLRFLMILS